MTRAALTDVFASLPDPRMDRTKRHSLPSIMFIAIAGIICGADDWVSVARFGKTKLPWLETFLDLPNGIPSHDTFSRVFSLLDPEAFAEGFARWVQGFAKLTEGEVVAVDGKCLRRSFDRASEKGAIHMVSAWASDNELVLGQLKTEEKSNEITAVPTLLDMLSLQGAVVTVDSMGCQKKIAKKVVEKKANYVLALKDNQPKLNASVQSYFREAIAAGFERTRFDYFEETGKGHGRVETRRVWCTPDISWMDGAQREDWPDLRSLILVEAERIVHGGVEREYRYYISSLPGDNAAIAAKAVRAHWGIENKLHWVLDVAFQEDLCRVRRENGPQNLAMLRHVAMNLLRSEKTAKVGIKNKRLSAGWDESYLAKVIGI